MHFTSVFRFVRFLHIHNVALEIVFRRSRVDGDAGVLPVVAAVLLVHDARRCYFFQRRVVVDGDRTDVRLPHHDLQKKNEFF